MFHKGTWKNQLFACFMMVILLCTTFIPAQGEAVLFSAPLSRGATQSGMVRVRLSSLGNPSNLKLTVNGSYTVNGKTEKAIASGSVLNVGFASGTGRLTLTHNGTTTDMGTTFKLRRHATDGSNGIKIAQGRVPSNYYPGDFEFISQKNSSGSYTLYVIVHVYIEDYLYGVLPYEMGNSSGLEALKAQAVAARTYTMRAMSGSTGRSYDVVDTTSDQVYSGTPSGNANCKSAVDATKGIVSKNGSAFTATYYSASNGGQTEAVKNAWGSTSYPYLKVKDDPYDLANPASKKNSFTVKSSGTQDNSTLQSLLNNKAAAKFGAGAKVTGVTAITPHTPKYPSPSKLYTKMDFSVRYTLNGSTSSGTLTFDIFNELEAPLGMSINSGSNELWSVTETANGFTVYSRRYGHGLGMSQRGAMYMAQLGYTYDQILAFYFEGCTRVQYTFTRKILSPVIGGQESSEETIVEKPADLEQESDYQGITLYKTPLLDQPGSSANSLTTLPAGAKVQVCAKTGEYYLVTYGSLCGYVNISDVSHDGAVSGENVSPTRLYGYGTVVNSNALNLRTAPSTQNSTVLTTVPGKTVLPVFSVSGNWAYVQFGLRVGYVSLDYIEMNLTGNPLPTPTPLPTQNPSGGLLARVTTEKGSLNLREDDASNAVILTTIPQYAVITVTSRGNDWCAVQYGGYSGYVMTKFLTFIQPEPTQAPVQPTPPEENKPLEYARVTTASGTLNLRDGKSTQNKILRTIPQYAVVEVHEKYTGWYKVTYNGTTGYAMSKFLTLLEAAVVPTSTPSPTLAPTSTPAPTSAPSVPENDGNTYAKVTTVQGSLNLRKYKNGRVLRTIPQYAVVQVLKNEGTWCKVKYEGTEGYVMTSFLTFIHHAPSATQAPSATAVPVPQQTATPAPSQPPVQPSGNTATVTTATGSLNLRKTQNGRVLRTIPQHATVTVLSRTNSWTKVRYEGTEGYVMTAFLTFHNNASSQPQATPAPTTAPSATNAPQAGTIVCYATVKTDGGTLNLRKSADVDAAVLVTIPFGSQIPVYQKGTVWSKVAYNGETGYVQSKYLVFGEQQPVATPTPKPEATQPEQNATYIDPTLKQLDEVILAKSNPDGNYLNLREYCSMESRVLCEIPKDTYMLITKIGDDWCQVIHEDKTGYCLEKYLEYIAP